VVDYQVSSNAHVRGYCGDVLPSTEARVNLFVVQRVKPGVDAIEGRVKGKDVQTRENPVKMCA
jgi:hypothetical protein